MITLITKKPEQMGNAILMRCLHDELSGDVLFLIETDFGNRAKLNSKEVDEFFRLGRPQNYDTWSADRDRLREMNNLADVR